MEVKYRAPFVTWTRAPETELAINGVNLGIAQVSTAFHQAQVLKVKVYQAMPIRHVLRMEGYGGPGRREGGENQCDFKPILVSPKLNNSIFQRLDLPSPLPRL